jgi:integrase
MNRLGAAQRCLGHSYSISERPILIHSIAKIGRHFLKETESYVALFHGAPHFTRTPGPITTYLSRSSPSASRSTYRKKNTSPHRLGNGVGGVFHSRTSYSDLKAACRKPPEAYSAALDGGRRDGKGGLSPRTVGHMHRVLKQALSQAVKWKELNHNPADVVDPPKVDWKPMQTYDFPQTAELVEIVRGTSLHIPTVLAVMCGLRRGEICALRWRNVDLIAGQISVVESLEQTKAGLRFKSPKSGKGRTVALSATVVDELRAHRTRRAQDLLRLGTGLSETDLVIGHADGSVMSPIYISHQWARRIARTPLKSIRFHDLRHSHATHLLSSDVHPKVASERLGHSKVGIRLDLYSHVIPGMQEDAAAIVDQALTAARDKNKSKW